MLSTRFGSLGLLLAAAMAVPATCAAAAPSPTGQAARGAAVPELVQKRQAVQGVSADAMAILSALERDPTLAPRLADNPDGAQALLEARGATRAEHISVQPGGAGAARTITITITIDHVTIEIVIKL